PLARAREVRRALPWPAGRVVRQLGAGAAGLEGAGLKRPVGEGAVTEAAAWAGAPRAGAAARADAVDEVGEALRQRRRDLGGLRLRELAGGHVAGDLRLLVRDERGDEPRGRLAAR